METVLQDLRFAFRMLIRKPGFTAVAALTLALGIGATSAVFSAVNTVILRPLPFDDPEKLVMIKENNLAKGQEEVEVSWADFVDWREQNNVFEEMTVIPSVNFDVTMTGGDEPLRVEATFVPANFFPMLGVNAALGRTFTQDEDKSGQQLAAVISDGFWKRRFGADTSIIGRKLIFDGDPVTVVGVMPADFDFPKGAEMWTPFHATYTTVEQNKYIHVLFAMGKLKSGVSVEQAQTEMSVIAKRIEEARPDKNKNLGVRLTPLVESIFGNARPALFVLLGAVLLVLLIACVNVANLLLARASSRQREMAVRAALGAGRLRLARLLLTESLLLAVIGGALGLWLAAFGIDTLIALAPQDIPRIKSVTVDGGMALFTILVSLSTVLFFGIIPAFQATKPDLNKSLKEGSGTVGHTGGKRLRNALVTAEVALAAALLIGAGLLIRSFDRMQRVDPGFKAENVFTARIALSGKYPDEKSRRDFYKLLLDQARALPGVESAAVVLQRPLSGTVGWDYPFTIEGQNAEEHTSNPYSNYEAISPDYFRTMGIPLLGGRDFTEQDNADAPPAVIVGETIARRYWPGQDPIGKRLKFGSPDSKKPWLTVVGVVKDARYREWDATRPDVYVPFLQKCEFRTDFVLRTNIAPKNISEAFRKTVYALDKDLAVASITTMEDLVDETLARSKFNMLVLTIFALCAIMLAAVGVYGVVSYSVAQRSHEIGIRMALGAEHKHIFKLIIGQGLAPVAIGAALGVAGAFAVTRVMESLLFGVSATDPFTFAAAAVLLVITAAIACYVPARRALKVDPAIALRCE